MLLTEYDERRTMEMFKEEGRAEGHLAALLEAVRNLKAQLGLSNEQAQRALKISNEDWNLISTKL